jgi:hypothetical protein
LRVGICRSRCEASYGGVEDDLAIEREHSAEGSFSVVLTGEGDKAEGVGRVVVVPHVRCGCLYRESVGGRRRLRCL